jgi:hypothetical protein
MSHSSLPRFSAVLAYTRLLGWTTNRTTFFALLGHRTFSGCSPVLPAPGLAPDQTDDRINKTHAHDHTFYTTFLSGSGWTIHWNDITTSRLHPWSLD